MKFLRLSLIDMHKMSSCRKNAKLQNPIAKLNPKIFCLEKLALEFADCVCQNYLSDIIRRETNDPIPYRVMDEFLARNPEIGEKEEAGAEEDHILCFLAFDVGAVEDNQRRKYHKSNDDHVAHNGDSERAYVWREVE